MIAMKNFLLSTALMLMIVSTADAAEIELGTSEMYSPSERNAAIKKILIEFKEWTGCELHSLRFFGDQCNSPENIRWMNALGEARGFTRKFSECIEFVSDFHSPKDAYGAWEADSEYEGWQWWLARVDRNDEWHLLTWGY